MCSERDSAGALAYAKNNSCRGHMAKREQSLWHSETLLCQGKTGSGEVKNAAFTKFLWVSFTHLRPGWCAAFTLCHIYVCTYPGPVMARFQ